MARRDVHLGVDYGTSTSKLVVRDLGAAGGAQAMPIVVGGEFRIPSSVSVAGERLLFGRASSSPGESRLHSVKMFAAQEIKSSMYSLAAPPLPAGLRFQDIALLTVWWLLGLGRDDSARQLRVAKGDVALDFSLGVPMHFHADEAVRRAFLQIAIGAGLLLKREGSLPAGELPIARARELAAYAFDEATRQPPTDSLVRSEAQAAIWFTYQSPKAPQGPYMKVDVGAGTTNVSVFRLHGDLRARTKEQLNVFGTSSSSTGMDNVGRKLADALGVADLTTVRGHEDKHLAGPRARQSVVPVVLPVVNEMFQVLKQGWGKSLRKLRGLHSELETWRNEGRLLLVGGGSLVTLIRDRLQDHPAEEGRKLRLLELDVPRDLRLGAVSKSALPFMLVAYGLSDPDLEIQEVKSPDQISDAPRSGGAGSATVKCACRGSNDECPNCFGKGEYVPGVAHAYAERTTPSVPQARPVTKSPKLVSRPPAKTVECGVCRQRVTDIKAHSFTHLPPKKTKSAAQRRALPGAPRTELARCPQCGDMVRPDHLDAHLSRRCKKRQPVQPRQAFAAPPVPPPPPPEPPKVDAPKLSDVDVLRSVGLEVIDKRPQGGALWVVGGNELKTLMDAFAAQGLAFTYTPGGSKSTGNRPAWFIKGTTA